MEQRAVLRPYLHYVLDLWLEKRAQKDMQGEAYLTRFVDDFVVAFQYKRDAERFDRLRKIRMQRLGLRVAPDKTRLLLFGRLARERAASGQANRAPVGDDFAQQR